MDFIKGVYYGVLQFDVYSIAFAILILILILALSRAMFNLVIFVLLVCVVLVSVFEYTPQEIYHKTQGALKEATTSAVKVVDPVLAENIQNADVTYQKDGSFEVVVSDIKITGEKGISEITLYYKQEEFSLDIGSFSGEVNEVLSNISEGESPSENPDK